MKSLKAAIAFTILAFGCALTTHAASLPGTAALSAGESAFVRQAYAKQRVAPIVTVPDGKIDIDGDLSDWSDIPVRDGVIDDVLDHSVGNLNGTVRGAATFRFAHDSQALYAAVQVADPSIVPGVDQIYNGDAVEFFFDFRPVTTSGETHQLGDSLYTDGCYQIMVSAPVDGQPLRQQAGTLGGVPIGPYDVAAKTVSGGYAVELRIPFKSLAGVDAQRMTQPFGFDVSIDDVDALPDGGNSPRRSFAWSGNSNQWQDASSFGVADPSFANSLTPAPLLRGVPASCVVESVIGIPGKASVIVGGDIAPIDTPKSQTDYAVDIDRAASRDGGHEETTDYPSLGVTVRRTWWPAPTLASGEHKVITTYNAGLRQSVAFGYVAGRPSNAVAGKPFPPGSTVPDKTAHGAYILPNGIRISPAGVHIPLPGDMPQSFVWLDNTHLAVNTGGFHDQGVDVVDTASDKVTQSLPVYQTYFGMALTDYGLLVSGGHATKKDNGFQHVLHHFTWNGSELKAAPDWGLPSAARVDVFVAGVAAGPDGSVMLVNINGNLVYRLSDDLLKDVANAPTGNRPNAIAVSPTDKSIAVANWGDKSISFYDSATLYPKGTIKVGSHPVAMAYGKDGRLFVVCSGSNEVDVIDKGRVEEAIKTSVDPRDLVGSTPDALAISPDGKRLYVANADNNDVCVVDISERGEARVVGFIPTGWYPSAITISPDGKKLYVGVGKGLHFAANPDGKYIPNILNGAVSVVDIPSPARLASYTNQVAANNAPATKIASSPNRTLRSLRGKIKHVLYIIRENRTYDQVLGDEPRGNGDPNLTMFGSDVTPNVHKLVKDYILLDNLYCSGEVSENGHEWCDSAYATDFIQRAWVQTYSGRDEPDSDDSLTASPAGYLWDNCARHGLTYYSYGEQASFKSSPTTLIFTGEGTLRGHSNPAYGFLAWEARDTERAKYFIQGLHAAEKSGNWPDFTVMWLPEDHTHGLGTTSYTPPACVASNDLAVGQVVDAVSHSRFWKSTAIFIIEDDAQDGPDHVDAHRTVGLVISPYIRRGSVDHTLYTTASYVRTIEDLLGLPPMTQFDKNATPMDACFESAPVMTAYAAVPPRIDIMAKNQAGPAAVESAKLDFSGPDRANPAIYNRLLWQALKPGVPMPPPVRRGLIAAR